MFTKDWFLNLEKQLCDAGLDSDYDTFDNIKLQLENKKSLTPDQFATQAIYVVLAGGFSQKTAKTIHIKIMNVLYHGCCDLYPKLISLFNNKNKINAVIKIWQNREKITNEYYELSDLDSKILYLSKLPHIGKITSNHLARNLGENVVKYDVWIQRLGALYAGNSGIHIDNKKLNPEIKNICDDMFKHLEDETGLPRGYIDVVLWKACQNKLIKISHLLD